IQEHQAGAAGGAPTKKAPAAAEAQKPAEQQGAADRPHGAEARVTADVEAAPAPQDAVPRTSPDGGRGGDAPAGHGDGPAADAPGQPDGRGGATRNKRGRDQAADAPSDAASEGGDSSPRRSGDAGRGHNGSRDGNDAEGGRERGGQPRRSGRDKNGG